MGAADARTVKPGGTVSGYNPDVRFLTRERAIRRGASTGGGADDRQAAVQFLGGDDGRDRSGTSEFCDADQRGRDNDERATRET
jgi:hypothetical protein